jgi:hypothetical protein
VPKSSPEVSKSSPEGPKKDVAKEEKVEPDDSDDDEDRWPKCLIEIDT